MPDNLTLKTRLIALGIYSLTLVLLSGFVTGRWLPGGGGESLWFFSAIGLWFYTRLSTPFFVKPRDSLATCATAALLLATVDL